MDAGPTLVSPINGETVNTDFTLYWDAIPGATKYCFQMATKQDFQDAVSTYVNTNYIYLINMANELTYYWRVRVAFGHPLTSPWSETRYFTIVSADLNNAPSLSGGAVSPTSGTTDSTFTYSVTYTDADDDAPSSIAITIDSISYSMVEADNTDFIYTDGKLYQYEMSGSTLGTGSHTYSFTANDGYTYAVGDTSSHSGPTITTSSGSSSSGSSSGGGGGGGGSSNLYLRLVGLDAGSMDVVVDSLGEVKNTVTCTLEDGKIALTINEGTTVLQSNGNLPSYLSVEPLIEDVPEPPDGCAAVCAYEFLPEGLVFDPYITLTMSYDPSSLPEGINPDNLFIAYWDGEQWNKLECVLDEQTQTISVKIEHFSIYAIMSTLPHPLIPEPKTEPVIETKPANFVLSNLTVTPEIFKEGETVFISVLVTNNGELSDTKSIQLIINGDVADLQTITLEGGENRIVVFATKQDSACSCSVSIAGLPGTLSFEQTTEITPDSAPESTTPVEEASLETATEEQTFEWWKIVIIVLICLATAGGIFWYLKRHRSMFTLNNKK